MTLIAYFNLEQELHFTKYHNNQKKITTMICKMFKVNSYTTLLGQLLKPLINDRNVICGMLSVNLMYLY